MKRLLAVGALLALALHGHAAHAGYCLLGDSPPGCTPIPPAWHATPPQQYAAARPAPTPKPPPALNYTVTPAATPQRTDWWLYDARDVKCIRAADTVLGSPTRAYQGLRDEGHSVEIKTEKNDDGSIQLVLVGDDKSSWLAFFPSRAGCEQGMRNMRAAGKLPDLDKLR